MSANQRNFAFFSAALTQLTRLEFPGQKNPLGISPRSLCWYPVIGFGIGLIAAFPVMLSVTYLRLMQGFVLFTLVIYLFLLEYLSGFRQMRQFTEVCAMRSPHESAGTVCCMLLLLGKAMALYMIFLRLALFNSQLPLFVILVFTPAAARLLMLLPLTSLLMRDPGSDIHPKRAGKVFFTLAMVFAGVCSAVLWAGIRGFGNLFYLFSPDRTRAGVARVIASWQTAPQQLFLLFGQGIHDTVILAGCCAIIWMIWHGEQKLLPQTRETGIRMSGAYCETMELALFVGALILTDFLLL